MPNDSTMHYPAPGDHLEDAVHYQVRDSLDPRRPSSSDRIDDPRPEQHEPRSAVHLTLDRLQPVEVAFHRAIASPLRRGREHRRLVSPDPFGEAVQLRVRRRLAASQPIAQGSTRPPPDQLGELVGQVQRLRQLGAGGADCIEPRLLGRLALLKPTDPLERSPSCSDQTVGDGSATRSRPSRSHPRSRSA